MKIYVSLTVRKVSFGFTTVYCWCHVNISKCRTCWKPPLRYFHTWTVRLGKCATNVQMVSPPSPTFILRWMGASAPAPVTIQPLACTCTSGRQLGGIPALGQLAVTKLHRTWLQVTQMEPALLSLGFQNCLCPLQHNLRAWGVGQGGRRSEKQEALTSLGAAQETADTRGLKLQLASRRTHPEP